jgi:hypothetical protein
LPPKEIVLLVPLLVAVEKDYTDELANLLLLLLSTVAAAADAAVGDGSGTIACGDRKNPCGCANLFA